MKLQLQNIINLIIHFLSKIIRRLIVFYDFLWQKTKAFDWKQLLKALEITSITMIVLLSALVFVEYKNFNFPIKILIIQSGSMEPEIKTGSLVFSTTRNQYNVGDVVSFSPAAKTIITHRIVDLNEMGEFITKGDANENPDLNPIAPKLIQGKISFSIPLIGYIIGFARTFQGLILLIIIPATILIYEEIRSLIKEVKLNIIR